MRTWNRTIGLRAFVFGACLASSASAAQTPRSFQIKIYKFAVSTSETCNDPVVVYTNDNPIYAEVAGNPVFGRAHVEDGAYKCVMLQMSDIIQFAPSEDDGACHAGQEQTTDVCSLHQGSGSGPDSDGGSGSNGSGGFGNEADGGFGGGPGSGGFGSEADGGFGGGPGSGGFGNEADGGFGGGPGSGPVWDGGLPSVPSGGGAPSDQDLSFQNIDGTRSACSPIDGHEDLVVLYLSTGAVGENGAMKTAPHNAFLPPLRAGDPSHGLHLGAPLVVAGPSVGTFVVDARGKVEAGNGECGMQPPLFSFE